MEENNFRIYKTVTLRQRKDGSHLVKDYGCNGNIHVIVYHSIWFDGDGKARAGTTDTFPAKVLGYCKHNNECKNLGWFIQEVERDA